jgi:hypothetical protein
VHPINEDAEREAGEEIADDGESGPTQTDR